MIKQVIKTISISSFLLLPVGVFAQYGLDETARGAGLTEYSGDVSVIIGNLIGSALAIIGVIFFLLMVYGGFLWMTDRGKGEYMERAKEAIIAAVIGLVIVLGAYAITNFVFSSVEDNAGNNSPASPQNERQVQDVVDQIGDAVEEGLNDECQEDRDCGAGRRCFVGACVDADAL